MGNRVIPSPYLVPGFYDTALAKGRHREIVGGRWDETGRIQLAALCAHGLGPHHRLLDIGAGSLRLGCKAVPYLDPGHYWATDASRALMLRGHARELADPDRLPVAQLIEDAGFTFPGVPPIMDYAIAFGVFTHLPGDLLATALTNLARSQPGLRRFLVSVFLAPPDQADLAFRQADGVVTHPGRPPYHRTAEDIAQTALATGWSLEQHIGMLPRGQVMFVATPLARGKGG